MPGLRCAHLLSGDQLGERACEIDDHWKLISSAGHQLTTKVPPGYGRCWPSA